MTGGIRKPAVAGTFYPEKSEELSKTVDDLLAKAETVSDPGLKAIIVPHAGYAYSGSVAAAAYKMLAPLKGRIKRVIVGGASHRVPFRGTAFSGADYFETPLGKMPIDHDFERQALTLPMAGISDDVHRDEHSLEVQLPFIQRTLGNVMIVPFLAGHENVRDVCSVWHTLYGDDDTLLIASTDLSHFLPYEQAVKKDTETLDLLMDGKTDRLDENSACGRIPAGALVLEAEDKGLKKTLLKYQNSGDTSGVKSRVVGYGAIAFSRSIPS